MFTLNVFLGRELSKLSDVSSLSISLNLPLHRVSGQTQKDAEMG